MSQRITFKISKTGEIKSEATGFAGGQCLEKTDAYLRTLGGVQDRQLKGEYYEQEEAHQQVREG